MGVHTLDDTVRLLTLNFNLLSREQIVRLLEDEGGFGCYDHEDVEDLRKQLRESVIEKDISIASVEAMLE